MQTHSPESTTLLRAEGIAKSFGSGGETISVLRGIDFALRGGDRVSIRGESGCGKSTLLNVLSGIERPDRGKLLWKDRDVSGLSHATQSRERGRLIGFVFQAYYLVPELNALENILLPARIHGRLDAPTTDRAHKLLERVGLGGRDQANVAKLSGGERQRLAIARALVIAPDIILADEPTGNLDERNGRVVMDLLDEITLEEQRALVLVTHHPGFAQRFDRRYFLTEGTLQETS